MSEEELAKKQNKMSDEKEEELPREMSEEEEEEEEEHWGYGGPREMTKEEMALYESQVKQTDGFEVDYMPGVAEFHQISPLNLSKKKNKDVCVESCKLAIDKYNEKFKDTDGELEFVKVLMGMAQPVCVLQYYVTFEAKNLSKGGQTTTYQAVVLHGVTDVTVESFRVKPQPGGEKKWLWQSHICCNTPDPMACKGDYSGMMMT